MREKLEVVYEIGKIGLSIVGYVISLGVVLVVGVIGEVKGK